MAPVTCGVANGNKEGAILLSGKLQNFPAPLLPVHRIILMLTKIG